MAHKTFEEEAHFREVWLTWLINAACLLSAYESLKKKRFYLAQTLSVYAVWASFKKGNTKKHMFVIPQGTDERLISLQYLKSLFCEAAHHFLPQYPIPTCRVCHSKLYEPEAVKRHVPLTINI